MRFFYLFLLVLLVSCGSYKQNIMFKPTEGFPAEAVKKEAFSAEKNYVIQKNDVLSLRVYTNKGEQLIDPNPELSAESGSTQSTQKEGVKCLVDMQGIVKLPMVGELKLEGLTLRQAEEITQKEYEKFFQGSFVMLEFTNKRVIVLGAPGGQVIPLANENTSLVEVLALAKGIDNFSKAHNIRLIRGENVYMVDFSTIQGFQSGNILVEPGDIVYVEPVRRPFTEGLRDNATFLSLIVSIASLIVIINSTR